MTATISQQMVQDPNIRYQLGNTANMIEDISNYSGMLFSNATIGNTLDLVGINGGYESFGSGLEIHIANISEGGNKYISWNGVKWVESCTTKIVNISSYRIINNNNEGTPTFTLTATISQQMVQDPNIRYQLGNTANMIEDISNYSGMLFSNATIGNTLDLVGINGGYESFGSGLEIHIANISEGGNKYIRWNGLKWIESCN